MKVRVRTIDTVDVDELKFDKLYKTSNGITRAVIKYDNGPLYVRGPVMKLGQDVCKTDNFYYLSLEGNEGKFKNFIRYVDNFAISEIFHDTEHWYPESKEVPLAQIERDFNPTMKPSTLRGLPTLQLKCAQQLTEFYDGEGELVPYNLLKSGYSCVPILSIDSVYKSSDRIWVEIGLPQLKVKIPESVLKSCQLVDVAESDEDEDGDIPEDPDFY